MSFEIPLMDGRTVYMCESSLVNAESHEIVWIPAELFKKIWKDEPYCKESPEQWVDIEHHKKKYANTDEHFRKGLSSPVPLADVSVYLYPVNVAAKFINRRPRPIRFFYDLKIAMHRKFNIGRQYCILCFNDGMTRTMWLLNNGATSFPLACSAGGDILRKYVADMN